MTIPRKFSWKIFALSVLYILLIFPLFWFSSMIKSRFGFFAGILGNVLIFWYIIISIWLIEKYYSKNNKNKRYANLNKPVKNELTVYKRIKFAFIVGIIIALVDFGYFIFLLFKFDQTNYFLLLDIVLILILSYGLLKRNRLCSTLLFIYFTFWKIVQLITFGVNFPGIFISIFLIFILFDGMRATFQYNKSKKSQN
ncbi:MAG: hypothetical protein AABX33_08540 [Nanoarchaeota archaeon]